MQHGRLEAVVVQSRTRGRNGILGWKKCRDLEAVVIVYVVGSVSNLR